MNFQQAFNKIYSEDSTTLKQYDYFVKTNFDGRGEQGSPVIVTKTANKKGAISKRIKEKQSSKEMRETLAHLVSWYQDDDDVVAIEVVDGYDEIARVELR